MLVQREAELFVLDLEPERLTGRCVDPPLSLGVPKAPAVDNTSPGSARTISSTHRSGPFVVWGNDLTAASLKPIKPVQSRGSVPRFRLSVSRSSMEVKFEGSRTLTRSGAFF